MRNYLMKKFSLLYLTILILILTGCSYPGLKSTKNKLPNQTEQLCIELKRNLTFNGTSAPQIGANFANQQAQLLRLYDKYGCANLGK